jgi:NIPSNAP
MIFDHRTYNIKPNRLGKFLETYERLALPLQRKYLGEPYGFFVTHIGPMSRVVHLWQYENLADREWLAYRRLALEEDTLVDMENQILKPAPFFVPR